MAEERIYVIPLRKKFLKVPIYRRSEKAVSLIKSFLMKHMKVEVVKIGKYLNLEIMKHGRKNPPGKIKVKAVKDKVKVKEKEIEVVKAELINAPAEVKKEEAKSEKKEEIKVQEESKKEEVKTEKEEKEKKEVLEHARLEKKARKTKSFIDKTKPTQEQKKSGIIGSTGK
jgi:large subunit ribosomal protein L31e